MHEQRYTNPHDALLQVILSFSGTGEAAFAGVGLFAHPDVSCRCGAGYYLDVGSAPVRMSEGAVSRTPDRLVVFFFCIFT